jgi:hypothetical protein
MKKIREMALYLQHYFAAGDNIPETQYMQLAVCQCEILTIL